MIEPAFAIITTTDLPRSMSFYVDMLGGAVGYRFPEEGAWGERTARVTDPDGIVVIVGARSH